MKGKLTGAENSIQIPQEKVASKGVPLLGIDRAVLATLHPTSHLQVGVVWD